MTTPPNIKRWGLFSNSSPHDSVRRYQLARLEEVALAYPVPGSDRPPPRRIQAVPSLAAEDDAPAEEAAA